MLRGADVLVRSAKAKLPMATATAGRHRSLPPIITAADQNCCRSELLPIAIAVERNPGLTNHVIPTPSIA